MKAKLNTLLRKMDTSDLGYTEGVYRINNYHLGRLKLMNGHYREILGKSPFARDKEIKKELLVEVPDTFSISFSDGTIPLGSIQFETIEFFRKLYTTSFMEGTNGTRLNTNGTRLNIDHIFKKYIPRLEFLAIDLELESFKNSYPIGEFRLFAKDPPTLKNMLIAIPTLGDIDVPYEAQ